MAQSARVDFDGQINQLSQEIDEKTREYESVKKRLAPLKVVSSQTFEKLAPDAVHKAFEEYQAANGTVTGVGDLKIHEEAIYRLFSFWINNTLSADWLVLMSMEICNQSVAFVSLPSGLLDNDFRCCLDETAARSSDDNDKSGDYEPAETSGQNFYLEKSIRPQTSQRLFALCVATDQPSFPIPEGIQTWTDEKFCHLLVLDSTIDELTRYSSLPQYSQTFQFYGCIPRDVAGAISEYLKNFIEKLGSFVDCHMMYPFRVPPFLETIVFATNREFVHL